MVPLTRLATIFQLQFLTIIFSPFQLVCFSLMKWFLCLFIQMCHSKAYESSSPLYFLHVPLKFDHLIKKCLNFCSYLNAQSQNISGCHHCKHSRLSQRRCTCVKILNPAWAEKQTILRTSYMDFLPCLHLSTPTMKYPEENGDSQVEDTNSDTVFQLLPSQNAWSKQKGNTHTRDLLCLFYISKNIKSTNVNS